MHGIPVGAIVKGRPLGDVLTEYMRIYDVAKATYLESHPNAGECEVFAETTTAAVYRLYLLGVEDGMKGD